MGPPKNVDPDIEWLEAAPERSASILARLQGTEPPDPPDPPDPGPDPIPPTEGDGMDSVTNETQLRDALQTYANERRVGSLGNKTPINMTKPIVIKQTNHDGTPWGANLNYLKMNWTGPGGQDMLTYQGVDGIQNRCLVLEKASFFGNGYSGAACGACLKVYAPDGDPGSIYKFTLRDIFTSYGTNGIFLHGAVFEGLLDNVHAENHNADGIRMEHIFEPRWSIVSNIMVMHPNSSRNFGAGMKQVYSVNSIFGSYVLNALGGIVGPDGIRVVAFSNGENTGEQLFNLGSNGYGSVVTACEGSTDASSHARKYEGGQWVSKGKPMLYGMNNVGAFQEGNHIAFYGSGANNTRWLK